MTGFTLGAKPRGTRPLPPVDKIFLKTIKTAANELEENNNYQETLKWLENRKNQKIFVQAI